MNGLIFIGGLGSGEIVLIVVVLLILFGGTKLPELMRGAGRGIREFKEAIKEPMDEIKSEVEDKEPKKE